ncbi:MAG: stage sporulation protein [Clostridiales bacterium]|jgi:stage III sporulation protein AG|nr:stage sporulation protein [Clostridiales bacterium]MDK2934500.1 stage sporulation protein [Clostridiales bacterium]
MRGIFVEFLKKFYNNHFAREKNMVNLAIILITGIIIVIAGGSFFGGNNKDIDKNDAIQHTQNLNLPKEENDANTYGEKLEKKLENILSQIDGVGKVAIMITLSSSSEIVPAMDYNSGETITVESDNQGGNRKITQSEKENKILILNEQGGKQEPLILKELQPTIKGVIVVAEGASDIRIKAHIYEAVKTALGVPAHKVKVFAKN